MSIKHIDPAPRWSEATIYQNTLYHVCMPEDMNGDISQQTRSALASLDAFLQSVGSNKSQLLDVTIFLSESSDFDAMNYVWDEWITPVKAPVRCTVQAGIMHASCRIEIKIIAAIPS